MIVEMLKTAVTNRLLDIVCTLNNRDDADVRCRKAACATADLIKDLINDDIYLYYALTEKVSENGNTVE